MAEQPTHRPPPSRWAVLGVGMLLGFAWGTLIWAFVTLLGQESGGSKGWLYLAVSMAMIGGGVSAIFGSLGARRRGERIGPRIRRERDD